MADPQDKKPLPPQPKGSERSTSAKPRPPRPPHNPGHTPYIRQNPFVRKTGKKGKSDAVKTG